MKYKLLILFFAVFGFSLANAANNLKDSRVELSSTLNDTVKDLKQMYSVTENRLENTKTDAETLKVEANKLVKRSETAELNPSVLNHGSSSLPNRDCDYAKENLHWNGSSWICKDMKIGSGCKAAARDEYRYKNSKDEYVCSKSPKGKSLNYYYISRGYSSKCESASAGYKKLYSCNYKNKLGQVVEVSSARCSGKSKPHLSKKTCQTSWRVGSWGGCSKSCGGGTQTRSVKCPSGYICPSAKPGASKSCNTSSCRSNDRHGSDRDRNDRPSSSRGNDRTDRAGSSEGRSSREARGQGGRNVK